MSNMAVISETYRQAVDCIARWPDMYEEESMPQVKAFASFVVHGDYGRAVTAVQLAQAACAFDEYEWNSPERQLRNARLKELGELIGSDEFNMVHV